MLDLPPSAAHVFVTDLEVPTLDADDHHHLARVLRLRPGQAVTVADGAGGWRRCDWAGDGGLEPTGEVVRSPAPTPPVTVGFALTKGERPEWVVQKLTEVGVDRILVLATDRCVVRLDQAVAGRRVQRWRKVAREAAMQSRRSRLPVVEGLVGLDEAVDAAAGGAALAEPGGGPPSLARPAALVGPEGGWSPDELGRGLPTMSLGPTVLRAETAAVASGVLLCGVRAGLVASQGRISMQE